MPILLFYPPGHLEQKVSGLYFPNRKDGRYGHNDVRISGGTALAIAENNKQPMVAEPEIIDLSSIFVDRSWRDGSFLTPAASRSRSAIGRKLISLPVIVVGQSELCPDGVTPHGSDGASPS